MTSPLRTGIALATYNGERHLPEQLDSIANQTLPPSIVCVADDGSTDASVSIVERWRDRTRLEVRLLRSTGGHGPTKNFERACAELRDVDVVSFCDQDDIWYPEKLQRQLTPFERDRDVTLSLVDAHLLRNGRCGANESLWETLGFRRADRADFSVEQWLLRRTIAFGLTMAVRRDVLDTAIPFSDEWGHDNWTAVVAAGLGRIAVVDHACLAYRQHLEQVSGGARGSRGSFARSGRFSMSPESHRELAQRVAPASPHLAGVLEAKAAHLEARGAVRARHAGWFGGLARELTGGRYSRFSNGLMSAASDIIQPSSPRTWRKASKAK